MYTEHPYPDEPISQLEAVAEKFHADLARFRVRNSTHILGPESIRNYNEKFGTKFESFDQLKDVLYTQIANCEFTKNRKLQLLALVNPDRLLSDYCDIFGETFSKEDVVITICESDPKLLVEEEYWSDLNEVEKNVVMRQLSTNDPSEFLIIGSRFEREDSFNVYAEIAIGKLEKDQALYEFVEHSEKLQYLSVQFQQKLHAKVVSDLGDLELGQKKSFEGMNPYVYLNKLREQDEVEVSMTIRDRILEQATQRIDTDFETIHEKVLQRAIESGDTDYIDASFDVIREYINENFTFFEIGGTVSVEDRQLLKLYIVARLESRLPQKTLEIQTLDTEVTCPPKFLDRVLSLDAICAKTNLLAWRKNVREDDEPVSGRIKEVIANQFARLAESERLLSEEIFTDWDIVRLMIIHGDESNLKRLVNDHISPEIYVFMIDEQYSDSIAKTRLDFIVKIDDKQKKEIYGQLSHDDKLRLLILDEFQDKSLRKRLYRELAPQLEDWNLAYGDFLFLRSKLKFGNADRIRAQVKLYTQVGKSTFVELESKFEQLDQFFGKTQEEVNQILKNLAQLTPIPRELLVNNNREWVISAMTSEDGKQFSKVLRELHTDPNKLDELLKLDYLHELHGMSTWAFGETAPKTILAGITQHGINGYYDFLENANLSTLDRIYKKTHSIDLWVVPLLSRYEYRLSHPNIHPELALEDTKKVVLRRATRLVELIQEYLIYRHLKEKFGYSEQELSELIATLSSDVYTPNYMIEKGNKKRVTLMGLYSIGLMGKGAKFLAQNLPEIKDILSQGVTYDGDILEYFDVKDPQKSLEELRSVGGKYITDRAESERLTEVLMSRVLKKDDELYFGGKFQKRELVEREYTEAIRSGLKKAFEWKTADLEEASNRNRHSANTGRQAYSEGDLVHWVSRRDGVLGIARTRINYPKEILGQKVDGSDNYPGYVDCQLVDSILVSELGVQNIQDRKSYMSGDAFAFVYEAEDFQVEDVTTSGHYNHKLVPGAISFIHTKAIICSKNCESEQSFLYELKKAVVRSGLYIPIYASNWRDLLLTPEEFDEISFNIVTFQELEELVENNDVFSELALIKNTDRKNSLLEHCNDVKERATQIAKELGMGVELILLTRAAAKLHDVGKEQEGAQEVSNVLEAEKYLDMAIGVDIETKKKILLLVRNDELLGEILKEYSYEEKGFRSTRGEEKLAQFNSIFATSEEMKKAMVALYLADVESYGDQIANDSNNIRGKIQALGLL